MYVTIHVICDYLGVDFAKYQQFISRLNGIANLNMVSIGTVLYLPVTSVPSTLPYYEVYAHIVVKGDTVYKLCKTYGVKGAPTLVVSDGAGFASYYGVNEIKKFIATL